MNLSLTESPYSLDQSQIVQSSGERTISGEASKDTQVPLKGSQAARTGIDIVSENAFFRTCLARCLEKEATDFTINSFEGLDEWRRTLDSASTAIVLLCATGQRATDDLVQQELNAVLEAAPNLRIIVISDIEHPAQMIAALQRGAKGYVPMSLDLEVAIGAIKLVNVGGNYIPASSLLSTRGANPSGMEAGPRKRAPELLTERQLTVLEILRKGDPNKIIAHKLNMSEATVKIHVRNMMKKIHAKNRTELVCMTSDLF